MHARYSYASCGVVLSAPSFAGRGIYVRANVLHAFAAGRALVAQHPHRRLRQNVSRKTTRKAREMDAPGLPHRA